MPASDKLRFIFNASAIAFGGQITQPEKLLKSAAATSLSTSGGLSESEAGPLPAPNDQDNGFFAFCGAHSSVKGELVNGGATAVTTVKSRLVGFNVAHPGSSLSFFAGNLDLEMVTESTAGTQVSYRRSLTPKFEGLYIQSQGQIFHFTVHVAPQIFCDHPTREQLSKNLADPAFQRQYGRYFFNADAPDAQTNPLLGTFVTGFTFDNQKQPTGVTPDENAPNILHVQGLGRIHFGEISIKGAYQQVNLLRCELDSNAPGLDSARPVIEMAATGPKSGGSSGSSTGGSGSNNGVWTNTT